MIDVFYYNLTFYFLLVYLFSTNLFDTIISSLLLFIRFFSLCSLFIYILLCYLYFIYLLVYIYLFIYVLIYVIIYSFIYLFIQLIFFHNFNQIFIYLNVSIIRFQMGTHRQRSSCHLKAMACFYHAAVAQEGLKKGDR